MKKIAYLLFVPLLWLAACNPNRVHQDFVGIPDFIWKKDAPLVLPVKVEKAGVYDLGVAIRHHSMTQFGEVMLRLKTTAPDGQVTEKEYIFAIRDRDGKLRGEALGDMCDTEQILEKGLSLAAGQYEFVLSQATPQDALPGFVEASITLDLPKAP